MNINTFSKCQIFFVACKYIYIEYKNAFLPQISNHSKCHLLISSGENLCVNIGTSQITNSDCERLLGTDIDCKLSFENYINQICSKARARIKALARIAPFLNKRKIKLLMNAFFKSQSRYCLLSFIAVH